jgi:UDP-glucose 4-epimerase
VVGTVRAVISGGTSYTAACIAQAFARHGHDVVALCRGELGAYSGLRRLRLERMRTAGVTIHGGLDAENGAMAGWLALRRLDVWIHHHHPMEDFRAPTYDTVRARAVALDPLDGIFGALGAAGAKAVLLSGTYFEPGEGGRPASAPATPYAALKGELSAAVAARAAAAGLAFGKVVIGAPTGALENEDRLTPQLIRAAERRVPFALRAPESVMDMIPGETLAEIYVEAARERLDACSREPRVWRPSGWVVTARAWADRVRATVLRALGLELLVPDPPNRQPPASFQNPANERVPIDWEACLDRYAREWKETQPFR